MSRAADIRAEVSMWDVLEALDIPYPTHAGPTGAKISAEHIDRSEFEASLHIYDDHWYDYGTGEGGDVIGFVEKVMGCRRGRAMAFLENGLDVSTTRRKVRSFRREPVDLTDRFYSESDPIELHHDDVDFFCGKHWPLLTPADLMLSGLRSSKHGVWIPHWRDTERTTVVGVKVRAWSGAKTSMKGSTYSGRLWMPDLPIPCPRAVIVEGESDAMVMHKALASRNLFWDVYALPGGANLWRDNWLDDLGGTQTIVLALDHDNAGVKATVKVWNAITHRLGVHAHDLSELLPFGSDLSDVLEDGDFTIIDHMKEL